MTLSQGVSFGGTCVADGQGALSLIHVVETFFAQAGTCPGMDDIVQASMGRLETSQHLLVGRIGDGSNAIQRGNVSLPQMERGGERL